LTWVEFLINAIKTTQDGQHCFNAAESMLICLIGLNKVTWFYLLSFLIVLGKGHSVGSIFLSSAFQIA
jgi:hypothetical protein